MNNIPSQTTNPSLITAGLPSTPITTSRLIQQNESIHSHRTISDIYLNLSQKDINDVMTALHTLTQYVLKSQERISVDDPQFSNRSSNSYLKHHHHLKHHLNLVKDFHHDLYSMKRKFETKKKSSSNYPSYSSNAIHYQTNKLHLSSHIFEKIIYIKKNKSFSNMQILPYQAHTLQILQNNHLHRFMSMDSLNTKDIFITPVIQSNTNKYQNIPMNDIATQWSLPKSNDQSSKSQNDIDNSKLHLTRKNSIILTELTQSTTTLATNNSILNTPLLIDDRNKLCTNVVDDKHKLTKSQTERFLTRLHIPICKCSTLKLKSRNDIIPLNNHSSNKKRTTSRSIKLISKRARHHTSIPSKNNQRVKRSRLYCRTQSNNRSMTIIPSYKSKRNSKEDVSLDLFNVDTTFFDE